MFETLTQKKQRSFTFKLLAIGSGALHVTIGGAFILMGMWQIEEIARPSRGLAMASSFSIAQSGGSPKAAPEPKMLTKLTPKKEVIKERRQPSKQTIKASEVTETASHSSEAAGDGNGLGTGVGQGKGDGKGLGDGPPGLGLGIIVCTGDDCTPPPLPTTKRAEPPKQVGSTVLSSLKRISGTPQILPPSRTQSAMRSGGNTKIVAVVRLCLNAQGEVNRQSILKSSGYAQYDAKLLSEIRRWRYSPYLANGKPIAICSQVTFVYSQ